eukprot:COSAG02_NODE_1749_length_11069_cov_88.967274_5_plen_370_part_00
MDPTLLRLIPDRRCAGVARARTRACAHAAAAAYTIRTRARSPRRRRRRTPGRGLSGARYIGIRPHGRVQPAGMSLLGAAASLILLHPSVGHSYTGPALTASSHPGDETSCLNLVTDCAASPDGSHDATPAFVACQLKAPTNNGCVTVPPGEYRCLNVPLNTSHILWIISAGATILPPLSTTNDTVGFGAAIFLLGAQSASDDSLVENVSITGPAFDKQFTIDISQSTFKPWYMMAIESKGRLRNFTIANLLIKNADPAVDPALKFPGERPCLVFGVVTEVANPTGPRYGLIANITSTGGIWGYGTTQLESLEDSHFENLEGTFLFQTLSYTLRAYSIKKQSSQSKLCTSSMSNDASLVAVLTHVVEEQV